MSARYAYRVRTVDLPQIPKGKPGRFTVRLSWSEGGSPGRYVEVSYFCWRASRDAAAERLRALHNPA